MLWKINLRALNAVKKIFINFIERWYLKKRVMKKKIFHDCVIDGTFNLIKTS